MQVFRYTDDAIEGVKKAPMVDVCAIFPPVLLEACMILLAMDVVHVVYMANLSYNCIFISIKYAKIGRWNL